ncbi:hypothetical protein, partial [uncultured Roseovarius sp.]|uniref:hypothetical protein n=1 Tax=uncultured Roseovarius sp. TaxID=293344 RepID=UPI0026069FF0
MTDETELMHHTVGRTATPSQSLTSRAIAIWVPAQVLFHTHAALTTGGIRLDAGKAHIGFGLNLTFPMGRPKGSFSNWAFGSSSFSLLSGIFVTHPGHASLRSLADAAWDIAAR